VVDTAGKPLSGTPTASGTYTITTSGHTAYSDNNIWNGNVILPLQLMTSGTQVHGMLWYCNYDNGLPLAEAQLMLQ
jgi:hypothetical protein